MKFKTIWVSDIHVGSLGCSASEFIDFLDKVEFEQLILNGDIIDGWRLKSRFYFPQEHVNVVRKILSISKKGRKVYYITGNHDEFLRNYHDYDLILGNIEVLNKMEYTCSGNTYLIVHGDGFDTIVKYHKWLAKLGDIAYNGLIWMNMVVNKIRTVFNLYPWSFAKYLKHKVKHAKVYIERFEEAAATMASRKYDGIICGHIHHPEIKVIGDNTVYINSGDWVETCSWIGETEDGSLQVWEWNDGSPIMLKEYKDRMVYES